MNGFVGEGKKRYGKSFVLCFRVRVGMEVFDREIWLERVVEDGIKLVCGYCVVGG